MSSSTACQPDPEKGPQIANPARRPGRQHARYQESRRTKIIYAGDSQLTALFAESGQNSTAIASRIRGAGLRGYEGGHLFLFLFQDPAALPEFETFLQAPSRRRDSS